MSKVQHKHIEPHTFYYNGQVLAGWTDKSSLVQVVQAVHEEFSKQPPLPLSLAGAQQRQEYQPETIALARVYFQEAKAQARQLSPEEQEKLAADADLLVNMLLSDAEAAPVKAALTKHADEVLQLAQSNLQQRAELSQLLDQLEEKQAAFAQLREANERLAL